jgi:hypothetical protein
MFFSYGEASIHVETAVEPESLVPDDVPSDTSDTEESQSLLT